MGIHLVRVILFFICFATKAHAQHPVEDKTSTTITTAGNPVLKNEFIKSSDGFMGLNNQNHAKEIALEECEKEIKDKANNGVIRIGEEFFRLSCTFVSCKVKGTTATCTYKLDRKAVPKVGYIETANGKKAEVSILTNTQANSLFEHMKNRKDIPFCFPEDGCYARAHAMTQDLKNRGLSAGKVFVEGNLHAKARWSATGEVNWWYHVAPVVLVHEEGAHVPYVIDPSLFDKPVRVSEWVNIQTKYTEKPKELYFTNQYAMYPRDKAEDLSDYRSSDIVHMKEIMGRYLEIERARKKAAGVP